MDVRIEKKENIDFHQFLKVSGVFFLKLLRSNYKSVLKKKVLIIYVSKGIQFFFSLISAYGLFSALLNRCI